MSTNNGDMPVGAQTQYDSEGDPVEYTGLTKREYFAAMAMPPVVPVLAHQITMSIQG